MGEFQTGFRSILNSDYYSIHISMKKLLTLCILLLSYSFANAQSLLSESFNVTSVTSTPPTGWTVNTSGTTTGCNGTSMAQVPSGGFICTNNGAPQPTPVAHSGSGMGGYNSWDISNGSYSEYVSPALNFSSLGTNTFSVWVYNQQAFYGNDSLRFLVNTSPTSVGGYLLGAMVPNYNPPTTGWTQYTYSIPTTFIGTTNYIIIRAVSNYGYDVFYDDVDVTHNPPTPCSGTPAAPSISNAAYNPATPVCSGSSVTLVGIDPNFPTIGGLTYQWQYSSSATGPWANVTFGTGATTRTYNTGALTTSTYFRMTTTCTASSATSSSAAFYVPIGAPQPGFMNGRLNFCPGDTATYSVPNVAGTTYAWTLPSGWSGISTTNSILVTPGLTAGTISVTATTACGTSIPQTKNIILSSAPASPTSISGNANVCGSSAQIYSIPPVTGAMTYAWSLPPGWAFVGASNGKTINVTTSNFSGNIVATAINGCGSNTDTLAVIVVNSLPNPGTIMGNSSPCSGTLNNYSINPVPGATSYTWYLPSGWSGTTTGTSIQAYTGTTNGNLQVTAFSTCATSPTASLSTTPILSVTPSVTLTPSSTAFCQGALVTITAAPTNGGNSPIYLWSKNGNSIANSGPGYISNSLVTGDKIGVTLVSNAVCRTFDSVTTIFTTPTVTPSAHPGVDIDETPTFTKCAGVTRYFTSITKDGGTNPLYQWYVNNSAIGLATSNTFSSTTLNNYDTVTLQLTSNAQCPTSPTVVSNKLGIEVDPNTVPTINAMASNSDVSAGPISITASETGGGVGATFQWYRNGIAIPAETSSSLSSSSFYSGDHIYVQMYSYDPCANPKVVNSNEIVLTGPTSISSTANWSGTLSLYPNPNSGLFSVSATGGTKQETIRIDVFNMIGQRVFHELITPTKANWTEEIALSKSLANGSYTLHLSTENKRAVIPFSLSR